MACPENYKPSKTLLKVTLRSQVKEYPRVAALHGIAYVADPTRPKAERIGWFICIVASTVAALTIIFTLMERFQTDPMMNSLELQFNDSPLDLPRFYVCPPWKSFNTIFSSKKYDHTLYKRLYNWDFGQSARNVTYPDSLDGIVYLKKFFKDNAPSCEQFIRNSSLISLALLRMSRLVLPYKDFMRQFRDAHFELRSKTAVESLFEGVIKTRRKELNCSSFEMAITTAGICLILPSSGRIFTETPISFSFNTTMFPTRVYATFENDGGLLRHLELFIFLFPATVKTDLQETYTSPRAEMLARSQRKCFFPGEQSAYIKCVLDCRIANSLKYCDCVPWYLATYASTKECQIKKYECLDRNSAKIVDVSKCLCRQSCNNVVLKNTELEVLSANELCTIYIRARSLLKYKRTVRYGWSDLFVSFGGIAGLFLGCSLLSIIEFGYYFSLRTYCRAVLSLPKRKHNVIKINVLDTIHPVKNFTRDQERSNFHKKIVTFHDYVN